MEKAGGKFITIEGCEGVGKSTQLQLIAEYCAANNIDAVFTREPGGAPIAEKIRRIILDADNSEMSPLTELMLYNASRAQHVAELIRPSLERGKLVFCDRFTDSTMAYQGYARGLDTRIIEKLNDIALDSLKIDLTIFIDVDPDSGFSRKGGADEGDRLEREGLDFHRKVYFGFKEIARMRPDRVASVQACGTVLQTHNKIIELLKERKIL